MTVRPAVAADVPLVARVHVASWEGVYRGLMPDAVIDGMTVERRTRQWDSFLGGMASRQALLVAESDDSVVGLSALSRTRDEDLDPATVGEVLAIYVNPDYWGEGYGRDLMVASLDWMRSVGFVEAMLWVLDTNKRGRSFYERGGWRADGAKKVDVSFGEPLREVRYRIELRASPPAGLVGA